MDTKIVKESIKKLSEILNNKEENEKIAEFASMYIAKITIEKIIDVFKETGEKEVVKTCEEHPWVCEIMSKISTYGNIGLELGYAEIKDKKDVVSE